MKRGCNSAAITELDKRSTWRLPADLHDYVIRMAKNKGVSINAALVLIVGDHKRFQREKSNLAEIDERLARMEAVIYPKETKFVKLPKLPMGKRA